MERWLKGVAINVVRLALDDASNSNQGDMTASSSSSMVLSSSSKTSNDTLKAKKRKYDESYINLGFVDSNGSPLCMLCSKLLPNSSMVPAKMRRHLETVHPDFKDKSKEFFVRKKEQLLRSQKTI